MIHLLNSFRYFLSFHPSIIEWMENSFEFEERGSTIMIHLSNFFRIFFPFHSSIISREWLENSKEFERRGL